MHSPLKTYFLIPIIALFFVLTQGVADNVDSVSEKHSILLPEQTFPELADILKKAEVNAPQILIRSELVTEAEGNKKALASRQLPNISAGYQILGITRKRSNEDNFSKVLFVPTGDITLRQALYHWGSIEAEKRIGEIQYKLSKMNFKQAKDYLLKEIRLVYMDIYALKFNKRLAEEKRALLEKVLKDTEDKTAMKLASEHQLNITRIQYEEAQYELAYISSNLENALNYFSHLTGGDEPEISTSQSPFELAQAILAKNPQFDPSEISPRYSTLEQELEIEKNNFIRIRAEQLPKLNFITGAFQDQVDSTTSDSGVNRANVFAGLEVRWNIFDGFRTDGQRIASKAKQRRIKLELDQEKQKAARETAYLVRSLNLERDQLKLQAQRLTLNEKELKTQKELYDNGVIQYTDFLVAKNARDAAEYLLATRIKDYFNRVNEFLIYSSRI